MEGTAHRSLLEVDGLSYWPCKVLSPDAVPEPGTPRRVTVLTSWAVSDTLSVGLALSARSALLEGARRDTCGHWYWSGT